MDHLQTEARNPASMNLDELTALQIVRLMNAEDGRVIPAVATQEDAIARAIEIIADNLRGGGRLIYVGAGTSGRLGVLDATECPPTFNSEPGQVVGLIAGGPTALTRAVEGAEDHPEFAERDLAAIDFSGKDVLVGIATSGRTPYVLGAMAYAKKLGAPAIGLSCNPGSELANAADIAITPVVGPEILSGSTRLKAGTATKLVLNMLTTGAMVRLGKTFGNLMVDLRATNSKLRARTNRIVRILTGLSHDEAAALLQSCGGELKTALVVQQAHVAPDDARKRLAQAGGQVRKALHGSSPTCAAAPRGDDRLFLGIDGGGTHTVALLARTGDPFEILGRGQAGPSNVHAVGTERALQALEEAVNRAFAAAKLEKMQTGAACLGLAGADRATEKVILLDWAHRTRLAKQVEVTNDAALLLAAGTPEGWGVALVAGTGSIAFGRDSTGKIARAGGWGYLLGDEGGGYALTSAGLQAVARAADGRGPETLLTAAFLEKLGLKQPSELIQAIYQGGRDRASLAALAPVVLAAADADDSVARELVDSAAAQLSRMVEAVVSALGLKRAAVPLALAGGVLLANSSYRQSTLSLISAHGIQADPVTLVEEPAAGAVRLARATLSFPLQL